MGAFAPAEPIADAGVVGVPDVVPGLAPCACATAGWFEGKILLRMLAKMLMAWGFQVGGKKRRARS